MIRAHHPLLWGFEAISQHFSAFKCLSTVPVLKDSITERGQGLKQVDLWRFSGWSSPLLYVLQPLPLPAQSQQRHGILFHTPSSFVTQLDLKLFLFLRLCSVKAGGLQLLNKKNIQCQFVFRLSCSSSMGPWGLSTAWLSVLHCVCAYSAFPLCESKAWWMSGVEREGCV